MPVSVIMFTDMWHVTSHAPCYHATMMHALCSMLHAHMLTCSCSMLHAPISYASPHYYDYKSQHQRASEAIDAKLRASGMSRTRDADAEEDAPAAKKTRVLF